MTEPRPNADHDDEWLAVRYVLGELTPADCTAFEGRLACDQHAREALVRGTRLVQAVAAAAPLSTTSVTPPRARRAFAFATAATALVAGSVFLVPPLFPPAASHPLAGEIDAERLAALWSAAAAEVDSTSEFAAAVGDGLDSESASVLAPPDWMLVAMEIDERPAALHGAFEDHAGMEQHKTEQN